MSAALSYDMIGECEEAVEVLRRGEVFDELIKYIHRYAI